MKNKTCEHKFSHAPGWGFDHTKVTATKREKCTECGTIKWTYSDGRAQKVIHPKKN